MVPPNAVVVELGISGRGAAVPARSGGVPDALAIPGSRPEKPHTPECAGLVRPRTPTAFTRIGGALRVVEG
ncbi:hypothetical protein [Nocardia sp. NBC_00416]|uniref:hypothetical protein n=1 Tax=Nocardia sp. NBC_00416 TaxID=2975991 RepID=UPI002E1BC0E5